MPWASTRFKYLVQLTSPPAPCSPNKWSCSLTPSSSAKPCPQVANAASRPGAIAGRDTQWPADPDRSVKLAGIAHGIHMRTNRKVLPPFVARGISGQSRCRCVLRDRTCPPHASGVRRVRWPRSSRASKRRVNALLFTDRASASMVSTITIWARSIVLMNKRPFIADAI